MGEPLVDIERLQSLEGLEDESGTELIGELIRIFADATPGSLAKLNELLIKEDLPQASRTAHSLKSSCSALGALPMLRLAESTEASARAGRLEESRQLAAQLTAIFEPTKTALLAYLSARG